MAVDIPSRLELPDDMHRGGRRLIRVVVAAAMRLIFRIQTEGLERFPASGPVLLVSNHRSFWDIPAVHVFVRPWIYFIAKEELYSSWFGKRFLSWWGAIPINRERVGLSTVRDIIGLLRKKKILSIFPEGTRVPGDADLAQYPPHAGVISFARRTGAAILPLAIGGRYGFRRRVRIVLGAPISLEHLKDAKGQPLSDAAAAHHVMSATYALIDRPYPAWQGEN
ncbi:MAG: lysophospholipid acyltransferase family protein [Bacillota bacterium]|nr:lysophospholipid acyltransferase family protein [Bacillota bacterium]